MKYLALIAVLFCATAHAQTTIYPQPGDNIGQDIAQQCPGTSPCVVMLPVGSFASGITPGSFASTRPNVLIIGSGPGAFASLDISTGDYIAGGSIIQCSIELGTGANNWSLKDLAVDVGDALVTAGTCPEGDGIDAFSNYKNVVMAPIQNISGYNLNILLRNATSPFHGFKCENVVNCSIGNSSSLFGTHGFTGKMGSNFQFHHLWSSGHASDCVIFKAGTDGYQYGSFTGGYLSTVTCTYGQQGDGSQGVQIDAQNGSMTGLYLSGLTMNGTLTGLFAVADAVSSVDGLYVYGLNHLSSGQESVFIDGAISNVHLDGLYSEGASSCLNMGASAIVNMLTAYAPQCIYPSKNSFVLGGGGDVTLTLPAIQHQAGWALYDFYNTQDTTTLVIDPSYNNQPTETEGAATGTNGAAPAVVVQE